MKIVIVWDVAPRGFIINRHFGGTCRSHLPDRKRERGEVLDCNSYCLNTFPRVISSNQKMEATCSSETSVCNKPTQHHIPEDGILHTRK
jgi:hypothetical protein